jgi:hypothetical protein
MIMVKDAQYRVIRGFPVRKDLRDDEWHQIVRRAYSKHHRKIEKLRQQANRTRDAVSLSLTRTFDGELTFKVNISRRLEIKEG